MTEPIGAPVRVTPVQIAHESSTLVPTTYVTTVAFEAFYRAERARIGRALAVTLRDRELAIDAVDEAMARAYAHWDRVGTLDNPGGWVYRVGLNWSRSFLRRATRPAPMWLTRPVADPSDGPADPDLDAALGRLPVDQRTVVVCRLLLGMSEKATAEALHIRAGTVKSRLHRATKRLHALLDTEESR